MGSSKTNNEPKKKTVLGRVVNWVFIAIISIFVVYVGCRIIDNQTGYKFPFFGYRSSVIVSESMAYANPENTYLTEEMKRINKYDVIITKNYKSYNDINKYDVITYYRNNNLICHRVVDLYEKDGKQYIVTRGDSNSSNDAAFEYSAVRGKVVNTLGGVGHAVLFVQSYEFLFALFSSSFFVVLGIFIYQTTKEKKEKGDIKVERKDEHEQ